MCIPVPRLTFIQTHGARIPNLALNISIFIYHTSTIHVHQNVDLK